MLPCEIIMEKENDDNANKDEMVTSFEEDNVSSCLEFMKSAHKYKMPRPKLKADFRMLCVVELSISGTRMEEIALIMGIASRTAYADWERWEMFTQTVDMTEHVNTTAATIKKKFDLLWEKAIKADEINTALRVEAYRVKLLQSMGIIHKVAEKADIKIETTDTRIKGEVIDVIARRIESLGQGHPKGDDGNGKA